MHLVIKSQNGSTGDERNALICIAFARSNWVVKWNDGASAALRRWVFLSSHVSIFPLNVI